MDNKELTKLVVETVIDRLYFETIKDKHITNRLNLKIPIGVSLRHAHLSQKDIDVLFGKGYELQFRNELQPGQYAAKETITLLGPKNILANVRVLAPVRKVSQVEISQTDAFHLGITPPLRDSGQLTGSAGIILVGPVGCLKLEEGVIKAARHIHFDIINAKKLGIKDGDRVRVIINGDRGLIFNNVLARVDDQYRLELHIDTDEANAAGVKTGDFALLYNSVKGSDFHGYRPFG